MPAKSPQLKAGFDYKIMLIQKEQHLSPKTEFKKGHKTWNKGTHIQTNNALEIWRKNGGILTEEQKIIKSQKIKEKLTGRKLSLEHLKK